LKSGGSKREEGGKAGKVYVRETKVLSELMKRKPETGGEAFPSEGDREALLTD